MRPINLIPEEERGLHGGVARTGALLYIVLGSLAVLLIGVVMLVLTSNKVSDREGELAQLEAQKASVTAKASSLARYSQFEEVATRWEADVATVADSRFDWPRVIQQLSLVLPPGASISKLDASSSGGSEGGALAVSGPSLTLSGCSTGQDGTAAVVVAMKQIDGVTRVGLSGSSIGGENGGGEVRCPEGDAQFELTAVFDEAPVGEAVIGDGATTEAEPSTEGEASSEVEESAETPGETAISPTSGTEGAG
jgi:Tfp pilus assembly protein PilN